MIYPVTTGFGYMSNGMGYATNKLTPPIGSSVNLDLFVGYTYTEVANQTALDAVIIFNSDTFLFGLMGVFTPITSYTDILPFYAMIADFARAYNFVGMNAFLQGLISAFLITQNEFTLLNNVLKQQGIDLTNLGG